MNQTVKPLWKIGSSRIHDTGIFATLEIPPETRIVEYIGEKITKSEANRRGLALFESAKAAGGGAVYIFQLNKRYDIDGNVPENIARLINHSCDPNCEAQIIKGRIWIVSIREIEKGEELNYDYHYELEHFLDHPCKCGSDNCPGFIVGSDSRKKLNKILRNRRKRERRKSQKRNLLTI